MKTVTYSELKHLQSGNKILDICHLNMKKINDELETLSTMQDILYHGKKIKRLMLRFEYYNQIAKRIIKENK